MTALNLLPRKEFILVLADGTEVSGQFGTWALKRFGEKRKLSLQKIMDLFSTDPQISDMLDFVLCAVEYKERKEGKPLSFNDIKLCDWMDQYGEDTGETGVLMKLFSHAGGEEAQEEKKSQENTSNGPDSSVTQPAQELEA